MMARLGYGHINIVRPIEVVLTGRYVAFINEYVQGGSVSDFLKKSKMDEDLARYLFRQLLEAIGFCHAHKVGGGCTHVPVYASVRGFTCKCIPAAVVCVCLLCAFQVWVQHASSMV